MGHVLDATMLWAMRLYLTEMTILVKLMYVKLSLY
jgi:hypothetical protein